MASQPRERPLLTLLKQGASCLPSSPFCPGSPFLLQLCSALQKERKESTPPSGYPACLPVSSPLQPPFCISLASYIALSNSQVSPSSKRAVAGRCPFGVMAAPLGDYLGLPGLPQGSQWTDPRVGFCMVAATEPLQTNLQAGNQRMAGGRRTGSPW